MSRKKEVIEKVRKQKSIYKKAIKVYSLIHSAGDIKPPNVYLRSTMNYDSINLLISYLTFKASEIILDKTGFGFDYEYSDLLYLLEKYYQCERLDRPDKNYYEIDIYENWEYWSSEYENTSQIEHFHRDELDEDIKNITDKHIDYLVKTYGMAY